MERRVKQAYRPPVRLTIDGISGSMTIKCLRIYFANVLNSKALLTAASYWPHALITVNTPNIIHDLVIHANCLFSFPVLAGE
jgi:hypothetical protein